ncbi:DUF1990 domain-containing protein [Streptomyces sp. ACA25]|uniref:DUF1990 family protein n=1 Tax=Streptomyces sp. ACA25 TaxID=3022596 RepID=UPI0023077E97|nr:DUF1990 domain-containing protein [Streptomyces sp. ACA25]MDB1086937.1 DUF1990 domain-containing protein [Streptomyces sp. ACA25]
MGTAGFTYQEVGATRDMDRPLPAGYHTLRVRTRLGTGGAVQRVAGSAVLNWRMHRAVLGVTLEPEAREAAPGVGVIVGIGVGRLRLRAPCRVVWTLREADRTGWGYGTLPGHPESGEEAFLVERLPDDSVWLTVTAFSRPAVWWTRAAGPFARWGQRAYAHHCGRALKRLARAH